jgi:murein DD-endopeptidase MepM/ murein hydrolase activator NlpD
MDKKANNKTLNFFKKEGFYVILFVCLCIVATVASITANNNKKLSSNPKTIQNEQANAGDVLQEQDKQPEGALQVKTEVLKPVPNIQAVTTKELTASVSKTVDAQFAKPVANGLLARPYSKEFVKWDTTDSYKTNFLAIDIKAKLGEPVVAVMDGIVKEVGTDVDDRNGKMVLIDHQNGFVTKYSNLDEKILVKMGDKVTKKQQIATVGNTTLNAHKEKYGDHLHFEVLQGGKNIDPTKYVKYEKYQLETAKQ